jgi:hypothetical protein
LQCQFTWKTRSSAQTFQPVIDLVTFFQMRFTFQSRLKGNEPAFDTQKGAALAAAPLQGR